MIAMRNLKQLVQNSHDLEKHVKYFSSAEYFETTSEWLIELIASVSRANSNKESLRLKLAKQKCVD